MAKVIEIAEQSPFRFDISQANWDTTGSTIYLTATPRGGGTTVDLGNAPGAAKNVDITINVTNNTLNRGQYYLEAVADPDSANPVTLYPGPREQWQAILDVKEIYDIP